MYIWGESARGGNLGFPLGRKSETLRLRLCKKEEDVKKKRRG
jgi:hypothetical protein